MFKIRIIPSIKEQLEKLSAPVNVFKKRTFKSKRAAEKQAEGLAAVNKFFADKEQKKNDPQSSSS